MVQDWNCRSSQPSIGECAMAKKSRAKTARKSAGRTAARKSRPTARAAKKAVKKTARPKTARRAPAKRSAARKAPPSAGRQTVTAYLVVSNGGRAIDFYKRAFGAVELVRMP